MTLKEEITSRFEKCTLDNYDFVDEHICSFINKINESEHITTLYCCEGHKIDDQAYILFNVDNIGWDIYYQKIVPELSSKFCRSTEEALYITKWTTYVKANEYNAGIVIQYNLDNILITWEESKIYFWKTIEETFLKYLQK